MKRRSESFFGLHFDFHASPESCPEPIGATLSESEIREICRLIQPDFVQIDCKGHPGWASYPSSCGNAMPAFVADPLKVWRRVTREEGVALYMHYSGVVDAKYCAENPKESVKRADGTRRAWATRTNGRYVRELLIPQLTELKEKYDVDGVWVDGDCWGSEVDFDPDTVKQFERETGIDLSGHLPVKPEDEHYEAYRDFCRELFRRYVRTYVDALHEKHPDFQVASNWAYTDHMPEEVSANVDFISGDLNPTNSFESARYAGRAIAQQGMTWDLMSWNFRHGGLVKHVNQIMQEAAEVISLGGGFQNYITQWRDGSPRLEQIRHMKELAEFMRERQPYCFRGKAVHQAALLLSTYDRHLESDSLFSRNGNEKIMGLTSLLCDAGQSLEIVSEHTLRKGMRQYPAIIVPQLHCGLDDATAQGLMEYANEGGSLMLVGPRSCQFFAEKGLPVRLSEVKKEKQAFTLDGEWFGVVSEMCAVMGENAETVALAAENPRAVAEALAVVMPFGKGKVALVGADLGLAYAREAQFMHVELAKALMARLYEPLVRVEEADGRLEINALTKDGRLMIQLVNANGSHRDAHVASEKVIPSVHDAVISLRSEKMPAAMKLEPRGEKLAMTRRDGRVYVRVERVRFHEIIEVIY